MSELWIIGLLAFSGIAFALGGMKNGRLLRRYILPIGLATALLLNHFSPIKVGLYALLLSISLHFGYGENTPYWRKFVVFACYGLGSLVFGFTVWLILTPVICLALFIASNFKLAKDFQWKIVEFIYGTLIAITLLGAIK
jgi:hypothetical protein